MRRLLEDFALIIEAFADAFSGLGPMVRRCCEPLHFAGWR